MDKVTKDWLKLLDPISTRKNMIDLSVMITAYEFLKQSIVDQISSFYFNEEVDGYTVYSDEYKREVIKLDSKKNQFGASVKWLLENEVIDKHDEEKIDELRKYRNKLTHESILFLSDSSIEINLNYLNDIARLIHKIDQWWLFEVELPTNPDFDCEKIEDIDKDGCFSMRTAVLSLLVNITTDYDKSSEMYERFKELNN